MVIAQQLKHLNKPHMDSRYTDTNIKVFNVQGLISGPQVQNPDASMIDSQTRNF